MKHIIFDFDGTLVDSLPAVIKIAHEVMPELELTDEKIAELRNMSLREIIKHSGMPYWRLPALLIKGKRLVGQRIKEFQTFPGVDSVVSQLHQQGYQISVVSSNSEENIRAVLRREKIEKYFAGIYGNVGLFTKSRAFKVVMKDQQASTGDVVYIGDEVRDIEAAHKGGIPVISVTWGYNGEKILKKFKPTYLAHTPQELLQIITKQVAVQ